MPGSGIRLQFTVRRVKSDLRELHGTMLHMPKRNGDPQGRTRHDQGNAGIERDLAAKHRETFWVRAAYRGKADLEEFHYAGVQNTRVPVVGNLPALIEAGVVSVDYALHKAGIRARYHGYLLKIHPSNLGALFPPPEVHELS